MRTFLPAITAALLLAACTMQQGVDTGVVSSESMGSAGAVKIRGSSSGQSSVSDIVREPVTVVGKIGCLPKKGPGPSTMECAMGLIGLDGNNFALDANKLENGIFEYENELVTINGLLTPIEMISNDQMHTYDIVGVVSIDVITGEK